MAFKSSKRNATKATPSVLAKSGPPCVYQKSEKGDSCVLSPLESEGGPNVADCEAPAVVPNNVSGEHPCTDQE